MAWYRSQLLLTILLVTFLGSARLEDAFPEIPSDDDPYQSNSIDGIETKMKFLPTLPMISPMRTMRQPELLFVYASERYGNWSDWTDCIPDLCIEQRHRRCLDNSWNTTIGNPRMTMKCVTKYIVEKRRCSNKTKCLMNAGLELMNDLEKECGWRSNKSEIRMKIIGGSETEPHSWPWAVRLSVVAKRRILAHLCGGTLIAPNWILTAAHCLMFENPHIPVGRFIQLHDYMKYQLVAHIGDHHKKERERSQIDQVVYQAIIHPKYNRKLKTDGFDIALLYIRKPVSLSEDVGFACQPKPSEQLESNQKCVAVGWGRTKLQADPTFDNLQGILEALLQRYPTTISRRPQRPVRQDHIADELHEVDLPIIPNSECLKFYGYLTDHHVCAGHNGKDTCDGDSGGGLYCQSPVTQQWRITGITSFGLARGCGSHPGVYTSTASHFDWIASTISKPPDE